MRAATCTERQLRWHTQYTTTLHQAEAQGLVLSSVGPHFMDSRMKCPYSTSQSLGRTRWNTAELD